ncbi:MAG: right-handed parallel beta-helix repeat-containing protein [Ferruginibacter sp.]
MRKTMRYFLFLTTILLSHFADAKNYYVSASGNDANAGTSITAPWKSINKVNSFFSSIAAGDSILFKRGETFYGTIRVNKSGTSGSPIVISAYGTGTMPVITGMTAITSWTSAGTNLWKSNAISNKALTLLTVNDNLKGKGRYPNADAANGGYLNFEAVSGTTAVTDNQLSSSPSWVGGTIVIKPNPWTIGRFPITAHSGGTLTFSGNKTSIRNNYGYFVQDHLSTLDQQYEWYYNTSAKQVTMYSTSSPTGVKVSTADTLCSVYNRSYITIKGIQFQGAGKDAILLNTTTGITVDGCEIYNSGEAGVSARNSKSPVIQNCYIYNSYDIGVDLEDINNANGIVRNNTIRRSGADPGLAGGSMSGLGTTGSGHTIQNNVIDSSGYAGIEFQRGSNLTIKNNVISTYCFVKSDGGGIYTWNNYVPATTYTNIKILGNIIRNGVGVTYGTSSTTPDADGLFMDDNASNIEISDNSVFDVAGAGLYVHNNFNMTILRNTFFNNGREQVNFTHNIAMVNGSQSPYTTPLRNITFKKNILFAKKSTSIVYTHYTILDDIASTGTRDSNYYCRPANESKIINATRTVSGKATSTSYDLAGWKSAYSSIDKASAKAAVTVSLTGAASTLGTNLVTIGQFLTSITGISIYSPNKNQTVGLDLTSKITGTGSMKVAFPTSNSSTYTSLYSGIGAVSSSKNYLFRFKTLGTTSAGTVRVYLRKLASPFNTLTPVQSRTYGTTVTTHEFTFNAPTSEAAACFMIELKQNSGTTYIDDVELYEVTSGGGTGTIEDNIRFEYNATASSKTVTLDAKYTSVEGTAYNSGSIVLAPYSSKILLRTGSLTAATAARPMAQPETVVTEEEIAAAAKPVEDATLATEKLKINCFPNPSPDGFVLTTQAKSTENVNIVVYNMEGKVVYTTSGNKTNRFAFGNNFTAGTYIVKVMQGTDVQTMKLIKTK